MGNYIHKVPSNSHTSGATGRDGGRDGGRAAALPAEPWPDKGWSKNPHCPLGCPCRASALLAPAELCAEASGESNSITHFQCLLICVMEPKAGADPCCSHRGHADPSVQSLWKGCRGKPVLLVRARRPPCPALKWSTTLGFSSRLCATSSVLPSQRGADLCTDTGKAVEKDSWYGARQPPACSKSHTG